MKTLVVLGHYLPGYKAGGPIRSVANLVEQLDGGFEFYIVTSDRDLGDKRPYPGIQKGTWHPVGKAQVRYLAPEEQTWRQWRRLLRELDYDLIYLNSYFSPLTVRTLWLRLFRQIPDVPVVLAPEGEFSPGALAIKSYKKRPYLLIANAAGLMNGVIWRASSAYEAEDIRREISWSACVAAVEAPAIQVAPDLSAWVSQREESIAVNTKRPGCLEIVFLSRIARMKNLDFALTLLQDIRGEIQFDIYGPMEDRSYWHECKRLIGLLPPNIRVNYAGAVPHDQVPQVFSNYHLFLFPTLGENFGHVILEALAAGCPVLISDQTAWRDLEQKGIGWDVALTEPDKFRAILQKCVDMDTTELECWSARATQFAARFFEEQKQATLKAYQNLFEDACESCG
jgi:glycosyltransferase involved in cell wall biosynthesis